MQSCLYTLAALVITSLALVKSAVFRVLPPCMKKGTLKRPKLSNDFLGILRRQPALEKADQDLFADESRFSQEGYLKRFTKAHDGVIAMGH